MNNEQITILVELRANAIAAAAVLFVVVTIGAFVFVTILDLVK